MSRLRVLYLGPEDLLAYVCEQLTGMDVIWAADRDGVVANIDEVDAVFDASMAIKFDAELLSRAVKLKYYVTATTGSNHIDESFLSARGIPLRTLRDERPALRQITAAAEHSWLLLLACARQLRGAVTHVLHGQWDRTQFPGLMLNGRTLGLIGCGRIGQWMARYAAAFGMRSVGYDPAPEGDIAPIQLASLEEVLAESDIISVHVPLTPATTRMITDAEIARMKDGVIIINTSRGEVLDETAILAGLRAGKIAALGVDVLTAEPPAADHPLLAYAREHDNVTITPHIGGFSPDALRVVMKLMCGRIREQFAAVGV
jgi:D-3-phosphoglycerate dehydrogenase